MAPGAAPRKKVKAMKVSGYVIGPCATCGKEQRALLMFDDYSWGVECLGCGHVEHVDEVEYVPEGNVEY